MKNILITDDLVVSHSVCKRKSYQMLFAFDAGDEQNYTAYLRERMKDVERRHFSTKINCLSFSSDNLAAKAEVILNATIKVGIFEVKNIHLQKCKAKSKLGDYSYEPIIFSSSSKIQPEDRTRALYIGYVLNEFQSLEPKRAVIILIDESTKSIRLDKDSHLPIINEIKQWLNFKPKIPRMIFNKHCPICQFEQRCLMAAEKEDSISLLSNMTSKVMKKYESKGIFTIKQLSYIYKPRRRSRYWGEKKPTHQYELQALALRTQKVYTDELLELLKSDVEIYIDIESIPEKEFHYLIGVLVSTPSVLLNYSFWADELSDENNIWASFLEIVNRYSTAPIFHYGSYEKKVIKVLADRYHTNIDKIMDRLYNINEYIFGRIYFPTYTNRLKDICTYLGFTWTVENASGLNSIAWRYAYDNTHDAKIRKSLITYNLEDCTNLMKLKDVLNSICSNEFVMTGVIAANDKNQLLNASSNQVVKDFNTLLKSAHHIYERSKITLKKNRKTKKNLKKAKKGKVNVVPKSKIDKLVRVTRGRICPLHKLALSHTNLVAEMVVLDLVCAPKGIKKVVVMYWGYKGRCSRCSRRHNPPGFKKIGKNAKYGLGLKAWITYQRLAMRLPYQKISQLMEDSFHIFIKKGGICELFRSMSCEYISTEKKILEKMMESPKIHVDETLVNIQGKIQYVWVFTDGSHVVFKLTPTRNSNIVHQVLKGYEGVLISDFFAGYDAVPCLQQKCLVHLIRDINDDIRKSPFDSELEILVLALRDLLIPIFEAVEKYGLKKRNLNKFKKNVEKFYKKAVDRIGYKSEITRKYQKRLVRYKQSLFVFLERDEIPWNNNTAERALRHFAVQRKISGSFFAPGLIDYLILLGIMQTCRFQNKPLLEFLMSGVKNIDQFKGRRNIKGWDV